MAYMIATNGTAFTAEAFNDYLMEQAIPTFADATARNNAIPSPNEGQHCYLESTGRTYFYDGSWIELLPGTVSGLTARTLLVCTSTTRPSHAAGRLIYETDTGKVQVSTGSAWAVVYQPTAQFQTGKTTASLSGANSRSGSVTFPVAFGSAPSAVILTPEIDGGSGVDLVAVVTGAPTSTGFDWRVRDRGGNAVTVTAVLHWVAFA